MAAHPTPIAWKTLAGELQDRRAAFLAAALKDTKYWCTPPDVPVRGKTPSDQHWLRLFSSPSATIAGTDVQSFFVTYNLARWVTWHTEAVAARIDGLRRDSGPTIAATVGRLAEDLKSDIKTGIPSKQTSAASKLAFYALPHREFYIWDQFAIRAVRSRDWLRAGATAHPRRFERPYIAGGAHDYGAFGSACAMALSEEMRNQDFIEATDSLRVHFRSEGGPFSDHTGMAGDTFMERRFLDKLLFWEGQYLAGISVAAA